MKKGKVIRGDMAKQPMKKSRNLKAVPAKMGRQNKQPKSRGR